MAKGISIAISAKDNYSSAITTMRNANQAFSKDITGLQSKLDALNRTKITLQVDTNKAETNLKAAEKQYAKTGKAADKLKLELANSKYENARRNLSLVSDNAKQAEDDISSLANAVSKTEGKMKLDKKAVADITSLVGDTVISVANIGISSAYGQEAGIMSNSVLSTGMSGAAIGTAIAPGIGTVVGALGGALLGYIQGNAKIFENKDNFFKSYYYDLYNEVLATQNQSLTNGISIASSREANKLPFSKLLGGDNKAEELLSSLSDFALATPFSYDELTNISKVLLSYGYKQEDLFPLLEKVGDTGSALGMSADDMLNVSAAIGKMQTTGETTMEYLNPLLDRDIDVWGYLSEGLSKTKEEVQEMVRDGLLPGEVAAKAIADHLDSDFGGSMEKEAQTFSGLISTLEDAKAELDNSMGEGYNSTRKSGIQDQIDYLSGDSGEEMQDAYNKIGQWKASLENLKEQYQRDAIGSIMEGTLAASYENSSQKEALERLITEYKIAEADYYDASKEGDKEGMQEAGAVMGRILAEAQAIAANEYNASEGAQLAMETNIALAENIKNDAGAQEAYWDAGYTMAQQFTKGLASVIEANSKILTEPANVGQIMEAYRHRDFKEGPNWELNTTENKAGSNNGDIKNVGQIMQEYRSGRLKAYAYGMNDIPYDNYPALLHQGERVLTASENRNYGSGVQVSITGNNFSVRSDEDIEKIGDVIANRVAQQMKQAIHLAT